MSVTGSDDAPVATNGLDRRSLIKRAAAVGAAAWTAPVIIGSLASPAGALTLTGCYRVGYLRVPSVSCGVPGYWTRETPASNGAGCLDPNDWNNQPEYPGTITVTTTAYSNPAAPALTCRTTIAITDTDCTIDLRSAVRKDQSNDCYTIGTTGGFVGAGCRQIQIAHPNNVDRIKILISCGATLCPGQSPCPS